MAVRITYTHCPCCNSRSIKKALAVKDYIVSGEMYEIWECTDCTARFTQNAPAVEDIGYYYESENYLPHSTETGGIFNKLYQQARVYSIWWRYKAIAKITGLVQGNLLDIGTGAGGFPHKMKQEGWTVAAVEPDEAARQLAYKTFGLQVFPIEQIYQMPGFTYDVITLWHVFEHVHDIHGYFTQIRRLIKQNGWLVVAMPNYNCTDADYYKTYWDAYDVPRHLFHFSSVAFEKFAAGYGFSVVAKKSFWLDPFYTCLKSEGHKNGSENWVAASWQATKSNLRRLSNINRSSSITYFLKLHS